MLVTVGDFRKAGHPLIKAGYVEEWVSGLIIFIETKKTNKH